MGISSYPLQNGLGNKNTHKGDDMVRSLATLYANLKKEPLSLEEARAKQGAVVREKRAWWDTAIQAVYHCAYKNQSFTVDAVWECMREIGTADEVRNISDNRAMGRLMLDAKKYQWVISTGAYRASAEPTSHGNALTVWKSLIYRQPKKEKESA